MANPSAFPGGFTNGIVVQNMPVLNSYGGKVFWVYSSSTGGADGSFNRPFATISAAQSACTASRGDIIMVKPGHAETFTAALSLSKAGISVIGLGQGANRPTITGAAAASAFTIDAANVTIQNMIITQASGGTQSATRAITISAANARVFNCDFPCEDTSDNAIYVDYAGDYAWIRGNTFRVLANGPDTAIMLEGATGGNSLTGVRIEDNWFDGMSTTNAWDEGTIYSSGVHVQCLIQNNRFLFMPANIGGIEFVAAATGILADNYFGNGTIAQMLDPGSCMSFNNREADAVDENGRLFPASDAAP